MTATFSTPIPIFDNLEFMGNPFKLNRFDTRGFFASDSELPQATTDYEFAWKFLFSYNGSSATFNSYRRELERLLHWSWHVHQKAVVNLRREDIEEYIDFCQHPPLEWIGTKNVARFKNKDGLRVVNKDWRPFVVSVSKEEARLGITPDEANFNFSQSAMQAMFSILSSFYNFLIQEEVAAINPVVLIRQKNKYLKKQSYKTPVRRISNLQWEYTIDEIEKLANQAPEKYERSLFILNCLYSMYLRISELVSDERSIPLMSDFKKDLDGNWWFYVTGKGNKSRVIAVSDAMLEALKRYRRYCHLSPTPSPGESIPLVSKSKGHGAIASTRIIRTIVQDCFDLAYQKMCADGLTEDAEELKRATVHWLRHTGISEDVKIRPREHVRDDAGHATMQTTDRYIDSDLRERHASSKKKKIKG